MDFDSFAVALGSSSDLLKPRPMRSVLPRGSGWVLSSDSLMPRPMRSVPHAVAGGPSLANAQSSKSEDGNWPHETAA